MVAYLKTPKVPLPLPALALNIPPQSMVRPLHLTYFHQNLPKSIFTVGEKYAIIVPMLAKKTIKTRKYPKIYEKIVPIALGVILFAIIVVLLIIFAVALQLFPV